MTSGLRFSFCGPPLVPGRTFWNKKRISELPLAIRKEIMYNLTNLGKNPAFASRRPSREKVILPPAHYMTQEQPQKQICLSLLWQGRRLLVPAILMTMDKERTDSHL